MILGVDRLDYTKGINVRLRAFEELLEDGRIGEETVFVQIATPSRERVEHYIHLRAEIEQSVGRINGTYGSVGSPPVHYLHQSMPREDLAAFYLAADVMLVTPLRDGMNLVAKEYVACRHDDAGVLVLSEFTGAALELTSALLVNPHDIDGVKAAITRALEMPEADARERMQALRKQVLEHDVNRWARSFLDALGLPS
jgi:trehalose 6-phosphate synthase